MNPDLRDHLARILHNFEHGDSENDSPTDPCWTGWRPEADALMPTIRRELADAWVRGFRLCAEVECGNCYTCGSWEGNHRNPYLSHDNGCSCAYCYYAATGGGR